MAIVTINDEHLTNIANAIRDKNKEWEKAIVGYEDIYGPITKISKTSNATSFTERIGEYGNNVTLEDTVTIEGAASLQVTMAYQTESTTYDYVIVTSGKTASSSGTKYGGSSLSKTTLSFDNTDSVSFYFKSDGSNAAYLGYYAEVTGFDADGNLITGIINREPIYDTVPTKEYKPVDMAPAIAAIETGGDNGETTFKYRTPDEIYEQDRPSDWPILPDPEKGECYYLVRYNQYKDSSFTITYHTTMTSDISAAAQETYWGYIDENGDFISAYSTTRSKGNQYNYGKWEKMGMSSISEEIQEKMKPYYVIKTVGGIAYEGETFNYNVKPDSSRLSYIDSGGVTSENILEIKVNVPDTMYVLNNYSGYEEPESAYTSYSNLYPNLKFITLYNGTGKNMRLSYLCYNKYALRCIRFDKEENNIFTNEGLYTTSSSNQKAKYAFYGASNLQCFYPIDKLNKLTDITCLYGGNRCLPHIEIHNSNATIAKTILGSSSTYAQRVSIILPAITSSSNFTLGYFPAELSNFKVPALNPTSSYSIISGMRSASVMPSAIVRNVNLLNKNCYKWADYTNAAIGLITFAEDCPVPDGVTIDCRAFSKDAMQEMINSLPYASGGATLTIEFGSLKPGSGSAQYLSCGINQEERDALVQQMTDKGYTVSVVV